MSSGGTGGWGNSAYYEERDEQSVYAPSRRSSSRRDYQEVDVETVRSTRPARSVPDFLREDYGRTSAGPLVRVEEDEYVERPRRRPGREEKEEIIIRDEKKFVPPPRPRSVVDEDVRSVRSGRTTRTERTERPRPRPRSEERSRDDIEIKITRDERGPERGPEREPERQPERPRVRNQDPRDVVGDEVIIRRSETDRPRSVVDREDIVFRRGEVERRPRPPPAREVEKEEVIIRRGRSSSSSSRSPSPPPRRHRESSVSERVIFRPRERSLPPPKDQLVAREREEFIVRRRRPSPPSPSPSPPPAPRDQVKEEIIIRRTERSPTPPPPAPPIPEPEPEVFEPPVIRRPIIREEIHREIITHHRNFDHGVEIIRREPTPPPPPPPEPEQRDEKLEVSIRRRDGGGETDEEVIFERDSSRHRKPRRKAKSRAPSPKREEFEETQVSIRRGRSVSPARSSRTALTAPADDYDLAGEAEFYNRKALDRAAIGEAYNGATRDWGLVDIPPGTSKVRMDGIGGGAQEVTWQRYNGARRSRFIADGQDFVAYPDFDDRPRQQSLPPPPPPAPEPEPAPPAREEKSTSLEISIKERDRGGSSSTEIVKREKKPKEMWTEITKDLVIKEAIDQMGYGYEETEYYFYVMDYLRYEDVLQLVEMSDHIRRERRRRVKEIEYEREVIERVPRPPIEYERDVIYERRRAR
ncbi:hypothetical protein NA57DRAFT_70389 [Rhizodiscina lignyota]|uniref:DUF8035 domain-containing protein n=1 Tax=Rhizodiscina lignyota TaxID=1504668 RepID=A0A9P4MAM5_9PEZI|nr:hypothetical protein NA57DRAFT_70389 [Rhizodiscina lignyota]